MYEAPASFEYKILQLKQCLKGEALKVIEGVGHSQAAYEEAKEQLERKFGGARRATAMFLEEVDNFRVSRPNHPEDLEKLSDLIDLLTINLRNSAQTEEPGKGLLYILLQNKMSPQYLSLRTIVGYLRKGKRKLSLRQRRNLREEFSGWEA